MSERTEISFDAALMMALRADAQKELDELPTPAQLEERYPDTFRWDARLKAALHKRRPVLKRVLVAAMTLVILTLGALAVSADFRKAVYTMIQKFLPIEMQLTYQVDGEPLERLPDGYSDHYVPDGFEMDDAQKFERAENFLHGYTVRCSIIQPGQQSLFDNEHTVYETVKVGEADATLGTSASENGDTVYILSWEQGGVSNTIMGNISRDEIMKIAEI
ncbi:MAG: Tat pathway signal sequence [Clostridiales bacterium Nov_37_41]|nr:MAG: Tat pathway signal sequence [Clostridiales bacterium Nov_37_41]